MLLTLAANSLRSRLAPPKKSRGAGSGAVGGVADVLALTDLPRFTRHELGLYGINWTTSLLAGSDTARIDAIREAADKAPCPCLVLTESEPLNLCTEDDDVGDAAIDRTVRVLNAAHRLGCNAIGLGIAGEDTEDHFDFCIERLRRIIAKAERMEINILIMPCKGITADPDRVTDLIKKVGGFRVGTMPDFQAAARSPDPLLYLRRLVPYAGAISASSIEFKASKKGIPPSHAPYDLIEFCNIVQAVGYQGTLAIDYRGEGDPVEGVRNTKTVLESVLSLDTDPPIRPPADDLDDLVPEDEAEE